LVVSDGRSFIRSAHAQYDVIEMTLVDTWASTAAGAFALSEGYLYTTQAFMQYFEHLKNDGVLAVTRWEFKEPREALRVVSVALDALRRLGVKGTSRNFIVVSNGPLNEDGRAVTVIAKSVLFLKAKSSK
jgi:spermidine synthase